MGNGIQRLCFDVVEIKTIVRIIINFSYNSHIVSPDDVQSQNDLFHALRRAVHSLVTLVQDQVDGLVKTFQCALTSNRLIHKRFCVIKTKTILEFAAK